MSVSGLCFCSKIGSGKDFFHCRYLKSAPRLQNLKIQKQCLSFSAGGVVKCCSYQHSVFFFLLLFKLQLCSWVLWARISQTTRQYPKIRIDVATSVFKLAAAHGRRPIWSCFSFLCFWDTYIIFWGAVFFLKYLNLVLDFSKSTRWGSVSVFLASEHSKSIATIWCFAVFCS